jgi:hypothetical protein
VVELFVIAGLAFAALIVIGVLLSVFSVVGWFLWLPFKIIGWMFRFVGLLFALPFILIAGCLGGFALLLGAGFMVLPLLPLAAFGALVWWLFRDRHRPAPQARVVN